MKPLLMRLHLIVGLFFLTASALYSQDRNTEFTINSNGLIYSSSDMQSLRFVVDSLNLRFKTCHNKTYYAQSQASFDYLVFSSEGDNLQSIIDELKKNPSAGELSSKYASLLISKEMNCLAIRSVAESDGSITYLQGSPFRGYESSYSLSDKKGFTGKNIRGSWFYFLEPQSTYYKNNTLYCRFFKEDWQSIALPDRYSKLIQYVDCMIDTSAYLYLIDKSEKTKYTDHFAMVKKYIGDKAGGRLKNKSSFYAEDYIAFADNNLRNDPAFLQLVDETIRKCVREKSYGHDIEALARTFGYYKEALAMKRSYRVMGMCSMDDSPRLHALAIAALAAQSHSWDIFLRAHLDIMNDHFERVSDGSYAYGARQTYLKELEELNLNVVDLMLGLTLRASNTATNHYSGTVSRLGRALAESKDRTQFEESAIVMLKDKALDKFNRGLIFLLYHTYTRYLVDKEGKEKRDLLRNNVESFEDFIQVAIRQMKEPERKQ
jgi:hypothetical protein